MRYGKSPVTQKCTFTACCTFLAHSIKNLGIKKCWLFSSPLLIRRKPRERRDRRRDLGHPSRNSHGRSVSRFLFATVFFDRGEKLFPTSPHPGKKTGAFSSCPSKLTLSASASFYLKCISKIFSPPFPRLPLPFKAFPLPSQTRKASSCLESPRPPSFYLWQQLIISRGIFLVKIPLIFFFFLAIFHGFDGWSRGGGGR